MSPGRAPSVALAVLTEAATALHGEPELDRVLGWAARAIGAIARTTGVAVCLMSRDGSPLWVQHPDAEVDLMRLGDPRSYPQLQPAFAGHTVRTDDLAKQTTLGPLLALPIPGDDGVAGAALIAGDLLQDPAVESSLHALLAHVGVAVRNHVTVARMAEEQARGEEVVHRLQEAVRPPAPVVSHVELGVRYVAADPSAPTGGDLYDWVALPDGTLHLAVVDVMGKGVDATKHALAVVHGLRLLALDGCPLESLVERIDRLLGPQHPELVATLIVARYHPEDGRLVMAGAGHPPALLVADGRVREIPAPGIPVGWPEAGSQRLVELYLERDDTLILYTDGLIEATKDILEGLDSLAAAASATASYPANAMARALVERQLADALRRDDALALVLRRRLPPEPVGTRPLRRFQHLFSPSPASVPVARHLLSDWLERVPIAPSHLDGLLLIASELCTNAVSHAGASPAGITLRAHTDGDAVVLEVVDDGGQPLPALPQGERVPDESAERGRGLFLVQELADDLVAFTERGLTTVRAVVRAVVPTEEPADTAGSPAGNSFSRP